MALFLRHKGRARTGKLKNPINILIFYLFVVVFTMAAQNPFFSAVSFIAAFLYSVILFKTKALKFALGFCLPAVILFAAFNLFFVHKGQSAFLFINGNPITQESLFYGLNSGIIFSGVILWFYTFNEVSSGGRISALFSKPLPQITLLFSMTMRLIPDFKKRAGHISDAQTMIGKGASGKGLFKRIKYGLMIISVLITWSLENGIETADSMKARGYGGKVNKARVKRKLILSEALFFAALLSAAAFCVFSIVSGAAGFEFFPFVRISIDPFLGIISLAVFTLICFYPVYLSLYKEAKWRLLKSKI